MPPERSIGAWRSSVKNTNIARSLNHVGIDDEQLVDLRDVGSMPDDQLVIMTTGSQGEPLSALRRMAYREHRGIRLRAGDTVVFSATPIPGNERAINETIDHLFRIGCDVITAEDAPVHTSGHGHRDEIAFMLNLTRPRYLMPVHGDHRRLRLHAEIAAATGIAPDHVFRGENGLPLEIDATGARFADPVRAGMMLVDGIKLGDPTQVALRDRRALARDGIMLVVATIGAQDGATLAPHEIELRGVPLATIDDAFLTDARKLVEDSLDRAADHEIHDVELIQQILHDDLAAFMSNDSAADR